MSKAPIPIAGISLRKVAALIGVIFLLAIPTGAVVVNSGVIDFIGEDDELALLRSDGPNGDYVEFDSNNQLSVNITKDGVNSNSTTDFDNVFIINNTDDEPREVWINHSNAGLISLYNSGTGAPIGFDNRIVLAEGEHVRVGIRVDTRGDSVNVGETIEATLTIHSRPLTPDEGPTITVPDSITFRNVSNGSATSQRLTISNAGGTPLAIEGISFAGADTASFQLANPNAELSPIPPGGSTDILVQFSPTRPGQHQATISIATNDSDTPTATVDLSGRSELPQLTVVSGQSLDFGPVQTGDSERRSLTIRNDGSAVVTVTSHQLSGDNSQPFAVGRAQLHGPILPGREVTFPVYFAPQDDVQYGATLQIRTEGSSESQATISLAGRGVQPADLAVDPAPVDFGDIGKNEQASETVSIMNRGQQPLTLSSIELRGPEADQYSLDTSDTQQQIAPGSSHPVTVTFHPTRDGPMDAELRIASNDPDAPVYTVPILGNSIPAEIGVGEDNLDFGNVTVGSSKTLEIPVWNDENSIADLHVDTTTVLGRNADTFSVTGGNAPFTLEPGEENVIEVTYSPDSAGIKTAQLRILSDGRPEQIDVWMSNTGWRIRVQEVAPGSRGIDADEEEFQFDTGQMRATSTNVEVDANNLPAATDVTLNVSSPGSRQRTAGADEVSFRTNQDGSFDMNFVHDDEPPLPDSTSYSPPEGMETTQYVTLWHSISNDAFDQPGLAYRVRKTALASDVQPDEVVFRRYADGEWNVHEATLIRETSSHYIYRVELPGFSEFVISAPAAEEPSEPTGPGSGTNGGGSGGSGESPSQSPGDAPPQEDVEVLFDDSSSSTDNQDSGLTITELETVPGLDSEEGPLAAIDQTGDSTGRDGGGATARISTDDRTEAVADRLAAIGADGLTEVNQPIGLTGSRSLVRATNGIDGRGHIVRAVDISVPEGRESQPATIRLQVDRARFGNTDPSQAQIGHYTGDGWELLDTTVVSITDEQVVVEARTEGFSPFAVFASAQVSYTWTLPNGTKLNGRDIQPTFETPGIHNVTLTLTDAFGRSDSATYRILANDPPEVEIFTPAEIGTGESVTLRAEVTNEVGNTTVTWQFPDGSEATGTTATHQFDAGVHDLTVTAEDEFGATGQAEQQIAVGPPFNAQQLRSMATNMPFELQVLVTFLFAISITFTVSRLTHYQPPRIFTGVPLPRLPWTKDHPPEITVLSDTSMNRLAECFEISALEVRDPDGDLEVIEILVTNEWNNVIAQKTIELDGDSLYEATPERVPVLSRVYLSQQNDYTVSIRAEDSAGNQVQATEHMNAGDA